MFQGDEEKFAAALEAQGMTLEQLTQSIEESLWLEAMKAAVTSDVTVSEDEAKAYYEAHKAEYVEQESREVRHILISPVPDGRRRRDEHHGQPGRLGCGQGRGREGPKRDPERRRFRHRG